MERQYTYLRGTFLKYVVVTPFGADRLLGKDLQLSGRLRYYVRDA